MLSLLLLACELPGDAGSDAAASRVQAGPGGEVVATNVVPWVQYPKGRDDVSAQAARTIRIVDQTGQEVRARRVLTQLAQGTRVQVVPEVELTPRREYRLLVGGELSKAFRTGAGLDGAPPEGGELRDWTWTRGECPRLRIRVSPVHDEGPVWWEMEARAGEGGGILVHAAAPMAGEAIQLSSCGVDALPLPRGNLTVSLRWVDLAGNASPWWPSFVVPTVRERAEGPPSLGISSVP